MRLGAARAQGWRGSGGGFDGVGGDPGNWGTLLDDGFGVERDDAVVGCG